MGVLDLGDVQIDWLQGGTFRLDGGAMFGVVPKVLWTRAYPCDDQNFIPMAAHPLLVSTPAGRVLIETGIGPKLNEKQRRNFKVESDWDLLADLERRGLGPDDIDAVILTHLDWDHVSGATHLGDDGTLRPTFPRARHVVQAREWQAATHPTSRTRHGYWPENLEPLAAAGLVEQVTGEVQVLPGVRVMPTGGHTPGHQIVRIDGSGGTVLHLADLLPTHAHRNPLWVMAYDLFPLDSIAAKEQWLPEAAAKDLWLTFYHDPFVLAGRWNAAGEPVDLIHGPAGPLRL